MIRAAIIAAIAVALLTGWVTVRVRGKTVKAVWVAPLWGGGLILALGGAVIAYVGSANRTHDRCVATAERSVGGHDQNLLLYDIIDAATGTRHYTWDTIVPGQPSLREGLEINLPVLDSTECPKP